MGTYFKEQRREEKGKGKELRGTQSGFDSVPAPGNDCNNGVRRFAGKPTVSLQTSELAN